MASNGVNKLLLGLIVVVALIGGIWYTTRSHATIVAQDMTVQGPYTTKDDLTFKDGAKLVVKGDLTVSSALACDGGALSIQVDGNATINGTLACDVANGTDGSAQSISMVVKGKVTFSKDAKVYANGNVQIVSDASRLKLTAAQVNALYDEASKNSGGPVRVGPFIQGASTQVSGSVKTSSAEVPAILSYFVGVAHAQAGQPMDKGGNVVPNVVIAGTWHIGDGTPPPEGLQIPKPPKDVHKIVLNFDFGGGGNMQIHNFELYGPDGRDGDSDENQSCNARGKDGEAAMRMMVNAGSIDIDQFTLGLGNGGNGGVAETKKDCDPGTATGGRGGESGNFKMIAEKDIQIHAFHIIPGRGGSGGDATAYGKDGKDACPGEKGGDATATAGRGADNKKELAALGAVSGVENVTVDAVEAGVGGSATAEPGKGGNGNACKCAGGAGGKATANGGNGGNASVHLPSGSADANGGNGGNVDSKGGAGGTGGMCPLKPSGGNGGKGGDATSKEGKGGAGTTSSGTDGTVKQEKGGDGGNGGDGCGPGNGGKGGKGRDPGTDGQPGKKQCPDITESQTSNPPEQPQTTGGTTHTTGGGTGSTGGTANTTGTNGGSTQVKMIQAIRYGGKYIPTSELTVMTHSGCENQAHWHSLPSPGGPVKATDGSTVMDPGPECGFGTTATVPVISVPATK